MQLLAAAAKRRSPALFAKPTAQAEAKDEAADDAGHPLEGKCMGHRSCRQGERQNGEAVDSDRRS